MRKQVKIQRAELKDLQIIYRFMLMQAEEERKFLADLDNKNKKDLFYTKYEISKILSSKLNYMVIAKSNEAPIGCGLARIEKAPKWNKYGKQGYLGMLYVDRKHRNRGVAKAMQDNRIKWLRSQGIKYLTCTILSQNKPSLNLSLKRDFKPIFIKMYKELK